MFAALDRGSRRGYIWLGCRLLIAYSAGEWIPTDRLPQDVRESAHAPRLRLAR